LVSWAILMYTGFFPFTIQLWPVTEPFFGEHVTKN
jgi:hypothetical protein